MKLTVVVTEGAVVMAGERVISQAVSVTDGDGVPLHAVGRIETEGGADGLKLTLHLDLHEIERVG